MRRSRHATIPPVERSPVPDHPYGPWCLAPPAVAVLAAIATRRILRSLAAAILLGALIARGGNLVAAVGDFFELHLWKTLVDESKLRVFTFTLTMGALVGVLNRAGGMRGLIEAVAAVASNRRRAQGGTVGLGFLVFFDDYANALLLGSSLRPLADRLRISREKLAYLVDSTTAPVAGLAVVSTWIAVELEYIADGLELIGADSGLAYALFLDSIPYRFYVLFALALVAAVALLGRDFGPMLAAERKRAAGGPPNAATDRAREDATAPDEATPARWYNAAAPIGVLLVVLGGLMLASGRASTGADATLMEVVGAADSGYALVWSSAAALAFALLLVRVQRLLDWEDVTSAATAGARMMLPALAILLLASALSRLTGGGAIDGQPAAAGQASEYAAADYRLYTGEYLSALMSDRVSPSVTPTLVFLVAAVLAFATGSSWGTMGIVTPLAIQAAAAVLAPIEGEALLAHPVFLASLGGVLAGAIFGDHCSPISDTTVLSSQACGCDHLAHVWTQLPYAAAAAAAAVALGTLPIGFGVPVWGCVAAGGASLVVLLWIVGRTVE